MQTLAKMPPRKPPQNQRPNVEMIASGLMYKFEQLIEEAAGGDEEQAMLIRSACAGMMHMRIEMKLVARAFKEVAR